MADDTRPIEIRVSATQAVQAIAALEQAFARLQRQMGQRTPGGAIPLNLTPRLDPTPLQQALQRSLQQAQGGQMTSGCGLTMAGQPLLGALLQPRVPRVPPVSFQGTAEQRLSQVLHEWQATPVRPASLPPLMAARET